MPIKTRSCVAILPHKTKTNSSAESPPFVRSEKAWVPPLLSPSGRTYPRVRTSSSRLDRCFPDDRPPVPRKIPGIDLLATILLEIVPARCDSYGPDAVYRRRCEVGHCTLPFSVSLSLSLSLSHLFPFITFLCEPGTHLVAERKFEAGKRDGSWCIRLLLGMRRS